MTFDEWQMQWRRVWWMDHIRCSRSTTLHYVEALEGVTLRTLFSSMRVS